MVNEGVRIHCIAGRYSQLRMLESSSAPDYCFMALKLHMQRNTNCMRGIICTSASERMNGAECKREDYQDWIFTPCAEP